MLAKSRLRTRIGEIFGLGSDVRRQVFFVTYGTGITVETLGNALLNQFDHVDFVTTTIPFVTDASHAQEVVTRINGTASDPDRLQKIRSERRPGTAFSSPSRCRTEVRDAEVLFERSGIPSPDTSAASIGELASRVLLRTGLRRHAY